MNKHFSNISSHSSNIYIADYTELTKSAKGVEISDAPFSDIQFCTVSNPRGIECWGINFEKNPDVFQITDTEEAQTSQCECMIASKKSQERAWVCLMELKYCSDERIRRRSNEAFKQLTNSFNHLKENGIIDLKKHRVYFIISIPEHSNREPFSSFVFSQDKKLELKKTKKFQLLNYNEIEVLNEGYLRPLLNT
jgi:hypothetical protein